MNTQSLFRKVLASCCSVLVLGLALQAPVAVAAPEAGQKQQAAASKKTEKAKAPDKAAAKSGGKAQGKSAAKAAAKPKGKQAAKAAGKKGDKAAKATSKKLPMIQAGRPADFRGVAAAPDVVHVANWASYTRDHSSRSFVVIDKRNARMYVFDPSGKLKSHTPVLLGKAIGDYTAPGVGNKSLAELKEEEKTTPAGRFIVEYGKNNHGDDVLWIDYDSAVSMHRMREVTAGERRAERMATADVEDNRISNGCVNVPHKFYNTVLRPTVMRHGAVVYVLPETRSAQQQFGSFDLPAKVLAGKQDKPEKQAARKS